ncbi:MAG: hypothetical protein ACMXYB_00615 [Candidatus Woesearchaeota archaeon]
MNKVNIIFILVLISTIISGCTLSSSVNVQNLIEANSQVQSFLEEFPNTNIQITHFSFDESLTLQEEFEKNCAKTFTQKELYRFSIQDNTQNLELIGFLDSNAGVVECVNRIAVHNNVIIDDDSDINENNHNIDNQKNSQNESKSEDIKEELTSYVNDDEKTPYMEKENQFKVTSLNVQEVNGQYVATVTMQNENVSSGVFTDVFFEVEGVVTRQSVTVDQATSIQSFKLRDVLSNYDSLVVGNSYRLSVEVGNTSVNQSFIFNTIAEESGLPVSINSVEVNGLKLNDFSSLSVQNGGTVYITISFVGQRDADNAGFKADIQGYEQVILQDSTNLFRVRQGVASSQTLSINLPADMNSQQEYILRVYGSNDLSGLTYREYSLNIESSQNSLQITDLTLNPSTGVEPGQAVIANVRVNNRGQQNQGTVKTIVEVPELNIRAESFLTNLNVGEARTSEDMYLGVPRDAEPGIYTANVIIQYNEGYTQSKAEFDFVVLMSRETNNNLIISVGDIENLKAGITTSFDVIVVNPTLQTKTIRITTDSELATVDINPTFSSIQPGSDRTFNIEVTPNSEIKDNQNIVLYVKDANTVIEEIIIN